MPDPRYPTPVAFIGLIESEGHDALVQKHVLGGTPYAFQGDPIKYTKLRDRLCDMLAIRRDGAILVGSGRIGFSMSPEKYGVPFNDNSDLDFAVISAELFDSVWFDLLSLSGTRYLGLSDRVKSAIRDHRSSRILNGRASPHQLTGAARLARRWFTVFKDLGRYPELTTREVHGMLFRTRRHLVLYHAYGLREILRKRDTGAKEAIQ